MKPDLPRLYSDFADWFHLLTKPANYTEEADFARQLICSSGAAPPHTLLELGSGGGNNAYHLKAHFTMTLTDIAPRMLDQSRVINPECEHLVGDMRSLRLDREFDAVFIHDAVCHLARREDLAACIETAFVHCRKGGAALFMPDTVRERFRPGVHHGGHDGAGRSLRYMEWTFDADPQDTEYSVDFVYLFREGNRPVRVEHDTHKMGLFSIQEWMGMLSAAGFDPRAVQDPYDREVFIALKP